MADSYKWLVYPVVTGLLVATLIALWKRISPGVCRLLAKVCGPVAEAMLRSRGGVAQRYREPLKAAPDLHKAVRRARSAVRFVGISHRTLLGVGTLQRRFLQALGEAARHGVEIEFYFADPDKGLARRAEEVTRGAPQNQREKHLRELLEHWSGEVQGSLLCMRGWAQHFAASERRSPAMKMYAYPAHPLLRYTLIDDEQAFVSYYDPTRDPDGLGVHSCGERPLYKIVRRRRGDDALFDFFKHAHLLLGDCRDVTKEEV